MSGTEVSKAKVEVHWAGRVQSGQKAEQQSKESSASPKQGQTNQARKKSNQSPKEEKRKETRNCKVAHAATMQETRGYPVEC